MARTFSTELEALAIAAPTDGRDYIDTPYAADRAFGVRVLKARLDGTVTRRWYVRYTDAGHKPARQMLGDAVRGSMRAALSQALKIVEDAKQARRQEAGSIPTFYEAWLQHWQDCDPIGLALFEKRRPPSLTEDTPVWSEDTRIGYRKSMARLALWHSTKVDRITAEMCEREFNRIQAEVSALNQRRERPVPNRDGRPAAQGTLRLARAIFNSCIRLGYFKVNPCGPLTNKKALDPRKNKRKTSKVPAEKLPTLWGWLHTEAPASVRDYVLIGVTMAFRKSVINQLSWDMVDHDTRTIVVPDQMRGNKAKLEFRLPIPDYVYEHAILPRWHAQTRDPKWVLPSVRYEGKPVRSVKGALARLERDTGIRVTMHDLRRTCVSLFKTVLGADSLMCKRLLGHSNYATTAAQNATTELYIVFEDKEMREGMNKVMDAFLKLCDLTTYHRWVHRATLDADGRFVPPAPSLTRFQDRTQIETPDWTLSD